jgi:hypothetical protein
VDPAGSLVLVIPGDACAGNYSSTLTFTTAPRDRGDPGRHAAGGAGRHGYRHFALAAADIEPEGNLIELVERPT